MLADDEYNCGSYGRVCDAGLWCSQGTCMTSVLSHDTNTTCSSVCGGLGLQCARATTAYIGNVYCGDGSSGGYQEEWFKGDCDVVLEQSAWGVMLPNGCTYYGDALKLDCICVQL